MPVAVDSNCLRSPTLQTNILQKYLYSYVLKIGSCHHVWSRVRDNVHDTRRAHVKCRLLTGTYILQANRAAFNQHEVNPICQLCLLAPETRQHFISECELFTAEKKAYRDRLSTSAYNTALRPRVCD